MSTTDVVFTFSIETLDDAVTREWCRPPDQALLALARDSRVGALLSVDAWRSRPVDLLKRRPQALSETVQIGGRPVERVRPRRWRRRESTEVTDLEAAYRSYGRAVGRVLRSRGVPSATLVTYHPFVAGYCEAPWIDRVVFVARDDWSASPRERPWWPAYREAYKRAEQRGAASFAVSAELAGRISTGTPAQVVPNGVDADLWGPLRPEPGELAGARRPRAVYAGSIDDRLDLDLVRAVAGAVGSLVLAGPVDPSVRGALEAVRGVQMLGRLDQATLAAVVQSCDVGVLPHRDTPMTRAMSPLKLYEYLAAGLPVVATDLPPVRGVSSSVELCGDVVEWSSAVQRAVGRGRATEPARAVTVDAISWAGRMRPVVDAAVGSRI